MLDELNKELLRDLGIKALGDIIAILRYAKEKESAYKRRSPPIVETSPPPPTQRSQTKTSTGKTTAAKTVAKAQVSKTQVSKTQVAKPQVAGPHVPVTLGKTKSAKAAAASTGTKQPPEPSQLKIVTTQKVAGETTTQKRTTGKSTATNSMRVQDSKNATVLNASSALSTTRPGRQKLSERFNEYEMVVKKKKLSEEEAVTDAEVKQIRSRQQQLQSPPVAKQTVTGPTLVAETSSKTAQVGTKYIGVKVGDKIKLKAVPRSVENSSQSRSPQNDEHESLRISTGDSGSSRRTQFTVQVLSKQPGLHDNSKTTPTTKNNKTATTTVKSKPKVTVVPAQGKALNRAKPLTSIFDRLDAPSSSTTALTLLKEDERRKDNVFKRLGTKTDGGEDGGSSKTPIAIGVVRPAPVTTPVSSRLGDKQKNTESVFSRLGSQSI